MVFLFLTGLTGLSGYFIFPLYGRKGKRQSAFSKDYSAFMLGLRYLRLTSTPVGLKFIIGLEDVVSLLAFENPEGTCYLLTLWKITPFNKPHHGFLLLTEEYHQRYLFLLPQNQIQYADRTPHCMPMSLKVFL